jgi:hypothetical protein
LISVFGLHIAVREVGLFSTMEQSTYLNTFVSAGVLLIGITGVSS